MARTVTPVFGWDTPILGESADVPADLASLALDVENTIKALEPKRLATAGAGDAKKLLIVDNTGAPAFVAMSGDATISNSTGILSIQAERILTGMINALAVTTAKLAEEGVTSAKLAALSVTAAKMAEATITNAKIANNTIEDGKLKSSTMSVQRRIRSAQMIIPAGTVAGTVLFFPANGGPGLAAPQSVAGGADMFCFEYLNGEVISKSNKIVLERGLITGNVAPGSAFKFKVWAVKEIAAGVIVLEAEPAFSSEHGAPAKNSIISSFGVEAEASKFKSSPVNKQLLVATVEVVTTTAASSACVFTYNMDTRNL